MRTNKIFRCRQNSRKINKNYKIIERIIIHNDKRS